MIHMKVALRIAQEGGVGIGNHTAGGRTAAYPLHSELKVSLRLCLNGDVHKLISFSLDTFRP